MPNPPLLFVDNVFDPITLYPGAIVDATSEAAGHEAFRVGDYRRDRTSWQAANDGAGVDHRIRVHLPLDVSIDSIFLDRGHNLAGKTVFLEGSLDGASWPLSITLNVPSVVGGTTTAPAMCQTEEGAAWTLTGTTALRPWWSLRIPHATSFVPIVTGIILGTRAQLLNFGKTFDEDAGGRTQPSTQSTAGYRTNDPTYAWRTVTLDLDLIGATEYDSTMRRLRATLFEKNQPWVCVMDAGTHPERAWMYTVDGTTWGMAKQRVYRSGRIVGREHMARLT
jgi:hypothetical protein